MSKRKLACWRQVCQKLTQTATRRCENQFGKGSCNGLREELNSHLRRRISKTLQKNSQQFSTRNGKRALNKCASKYLSAHALLKMIIHTNNPTCRRIMRFRLFVAVTFTQGSKYI